MALKDIIKLHESKKTKLNAKQIAEMKEANVSARFILETLGELALFNPAVRGLAWGYKGIKGGLSAAQRLKNRFKNVKP